MKKPFCLFSSNKYVQTLIHKMQNEKSGWIFSSIKSATDDASFVKCKMKKLVGLFSSNKCVQMLIHKMHSEKDGCFLSIKSGYKMQN